MLTEISPTTKNKIFNLIGGKITIIEFEQWVYNTPELVSELSADDHLELISFNYQKNGAKYELVNLLKRFISLGEYETQKIRGMLSEALKRNEHLPNILSEFYDLYCRGYGFLRDIGLGFGLSIECPPDNYDSTWEQLSKEKQAKILSSFYPELDERLNEAIHWLDTGKVILTGQRELGNEYHYHYIDDRSTEEGKSKVFKKVPKKWWQIW